jgi:hypothetical protein
MPLTPGAEVGDTIRELHTGKTYRHTKKKFGKKRAEKQSVAIAIRNRKKHGNKTSKHKKSRRMARR